MGNTSKEIQKNKSKNVGKYVLNKGKFKESRDKNFGFSKARLQTKQKFKRQSSKLYKIKGCNFQ